MGEKPEGLTLERVDNDKHYCKDNCKWATYAEQNANKGDYKNNTSGRKGVSFDKRSGKWLAYINRDGKRTLLGYHKTHQAAVDARKAAEDEYASKR